MLDRVGSVDVDVDVDESPVKEKTEPIFRSSCQKHNSEVMHSDGVTDTFRYISTIVSLLFCSVLFSSSVSVTTTSSTTLVISILNHSLFKAVRHEQDLYLGYNH